MTLPFLQPAQATTALLSGLLGIIAVACSADTVIGEVSSQTTPESFTIGHIEGHRGARGLKPENTLPGFEVALDLGVDVLELDLYLSADDELIVWHDDELGEDKCGFSDGSSEPESRMIRSLTAHQIGGFLCDRNPDADRFPAQDNEPTDLATDRFGPVTLAALFDFVAEYAQSPLKTAAQRTGAASVGFDIETKRDPTGFDNIGDGFDGMKPGVFETELLAEIDRAGVADRVVIQSFDHRSLWAIRSVAPEVRLSALTFRGPVDLEDLAQRGANVWSPNFQNVTAAQIEQARALGLAVVPWTVNDEEDMIAMFLMGVDGVITDRPDIAVRLRD